MGVNSLPKTVTRRRRGCDLNPGPSAPESSTLTTRLPSHPDRWWIHTKRYLCSQGVNTSSVFGPLGLLNRELKCAENHNKRHNTFFSISILVISNDNSFRVLFDKIASIYFFRKIYEYFSVGNGQSREPALCQLYRRTFVPYFSTRVMERPHYVAGPRAPDACAVMRGAGMRCERIFRAEAHVQSIQYIRWSDVTECTIAMLQVQLRVMCGVKRRIFMALFT